MVFPFKHLQHTAFQLLVNDAQQLWLHSDIIRLWEAFASLRVIVIALSSYILGEAWPCVPLCVCVRVCVVGV